MRLLLVAVTVLISVLSQCGGRMHRSDDKPAETLPQSNLPGQESKANECDFAAYQPVRESHFVKRTVTKKVNPLYPPEAVSRNIQGLVNVKILVNRGGNVEKACAINGDRVLKEASEAAALQWKFKPNFGRLRAADVGSRKYMVDVIPFNFALGKSEKDKSR
jgi:outer membrane biosynthesis protein TonB